GSLNNYMEEEGYEVGMLVYRGFREVRVYGPNRTTFYETSGEFYQIDNGEGYWRVDGVGERENGDLYMSPPALGHLSGHGPFRKAGSRTKSACGSPATQSQSNLLTTAEVEVPARTSREDLPPSSEEELAKRCIHREYVSALNGSASSLIRRFEGDTEDAAGTGTRTLPVARLYASPSWQSEEVTALLGADAIAQLRVSDPLVSELIRNRGADDWLKEARRELRTFHVRARDQYDGAALRANDAFEPCPLYTEARPYSQLQSAEAKLAALRERRDTALKPLLAELENADQILTQAVWDDLDSARSIMDRAQKWAAEQIVNMLGVENVNEEDTERLMQRSEELRQLYARMAAEGRPVSDEQREADFARVLEETETNGLWQNFKAELPNYYAKSARLSAGYVVSRLIANGAPSVLQKGSKGLGVAKALFDVAEIVNATRNLYSLWGVSQEAMPRALAATESRAYVAGLIERYNVVELEYLRLKKDFETAVTSAGANSEREFGSNR
ncbi:MAG: hypothetical protein HKN38_02570, partial [Altererythrobacter sp.]|nr:hypothetical protein [Altererythrobacter sp.]